jgi:TetR/AcrR family transcriptional regulator, transcriptional repressor of bet genes
MTRKDLREARRIQLLKATISSICYNGFAKTTLSGVAKAAKLPPSLLRFYFRSKKELLVETLRHMALVYEASWRETVQRATTPMGRLLAMIEADFNPMISDREGAIVWYGFWRESMWRPEFFHVCEKLSKAYFEQAWAAMRQLAEEGGYDDIDPVATAHAFNAMINGLWMEIMVNPNGCDVDLARRACRDFLARAFPKESSAATALSTAA